MTKKFPENLKVYLDACCLNRPFDDQSIDRIRLESEAVIIILDNANKREIKLIGSEILLFEINKTPDQIRKSKLLNLLSFYIKIINLDEKIKRRAEFLQNLGFKGFDALHIASAELSNCDIFLTTDDKIIKLYSKHEKNINTNIVNPFSWIQDYL